MLLQKTSSFSFKKKLFVQKVVKMVGVKCKKGLIATVSKFMYFAKIKI